MRHFHVFDIGEDKPYFDDAKNREICLKVAQKCYLPANAMMLELINKYQGKFKIAYSVSGVALEQFAEYTPEVLESFQKLAATGCVEFITETYYHSLAALFHADEFRAQVKKHQEVTRHYLGVTPTTFRNTELIYSNGIADMVEDLGFKVMLTEGVDRILDWRSPNFVYEPHNGRGMKLLLKNYKLSDDIAFRFSQRSWGDWPLTVDKFTNWVHQIDGGGDTINLFMDYETIGEHQWADTGIFDFFKELPEAIWRHPGFSFNTPSEVATMYPPVAKVDIPDAVSWADTERDLSAWLGNPMQDSSIAWVYQFEERLRRLDDESLLHTWRKLQTSDHFYYMCTKYWSDGDVHKYFSVYDSPHDSYVIMSNVLTDLEIKLKVREQVDSHTPLHTTTSTANIKKSPVKKISTKKEKPTQKTTRNRKLPQASKIPKAS
jgi:alpha-amylase